MTGSIAASLARRDLILLLGALGGLVVLCWWYLINMARGMDGMSGMNGVMEIRPWTSADFAMMFGMWAVMMVGMMVPTAIRSVLIFAQIGALGLQTRGRAWVSGYWFTAGYVRNLDVISALPRLYCNGLSIKLPCSRPRWCPPVLTLGSIPVDKRRGLAAFPYQGHACLRHCRNLPQCIWPRISARESRER